MANIRDLVTPKIIESVWHESPSNKIAYLGATLFPQRKQATLDLSWLKGYKGVTPVLRASAYDAKATYRDRIGVTKVDTEIPYFKEAYKITEKDMMDINNAVNNGDIHLQRAINVIYNDQADLIASAYMTPERMIMQLLAPTAGNMKLVMGVANSEDYEYNYDPAGAWKATNYADVSTTAWGTANATPISDIQNMIDTVEGNTGTKITKVLMNKTTLKLALNSTEVKNYILAQNASANVLINWKTVKSVIENACDVTIIIYDKMYTNESGTTAKLYPNNYVTLLPDGALGGTHFAPTPEEIQGGEGFRAIDGKIACRVIHEAGDPVGTKTVVAESVLPSFERMDEVAVLKVA